MTEDRPIIGQLVTDCVTIDPPLMIAAAAVQQIDQDQVVGLSDSVSLPDNTPAAPNGAEHTRRSTGHVMSWCERNGADAVIPEGWLGVVTQPNEANVA